MKNTKKAPISNKKTKNAAKSSTKANKKGNAPIEQDRRSTRIKKRAMLSGLEKSMGVVSLACQFAQIDRATHYRWLGKDTKYAEACEEIRIVTKDFGENALHKKIAAGDTAAIIFFNKTQNKDRGYIERSEVTGANGQPLVPKRQVMIIGGKEVEFT